MGQRPLTSSRVRRSNYALSCPFKTNLFLLPSALSQTPVITPIRIDPFSAAAAFPAEASASFFFVNADGTKYYSVARAATDTVLSAATPSTVLKRHNLTSAEAAACSPLPTVRTSSTRRPTTSSAGTQPIDVAVALDASSASVLSSTSNLLTAVDLTTNVTVGNPVTIPGICIGVAVGPNSLINVAATNGVYEIDGRFMTIRTEFPVNALPGKIVFTPGGRYGVMINQTSATGSAVISIQPPTSIIAVASPTVPVILNTLTVAPAGRIYATSNQTRALYEILVEPLRISPNFSQTSH